MSQHVAIYQVMSTSDTVLKAPPTELDPTFKEISFTVPSDTATDNPPVLSFLFTISNSVNLKFSIVLNGTTRFLVLNGNGSGFVQQVVKQGKLIPGAVNTLSCAIESGSGNVAFSEMVLWFQRNI
jgi:hypothetical protein